MIRSLEKQFESEKVDRFRKLAERLRQLPYPPGASRYYGLELASCIEAGALLGALVVGSSLIELYIRALVVNHSRSALQSLVPRKKSLENLLEENKKLGFGDIIDKLISVGLFDKVDGQNAKTLYKNIRIPLLHGLPRRFVRQHQEPFAEVFALMLGGEAISTRELEGVIEDHALEYLENIIGIVERNSL